MTKSERRRRKSAALLFMASGPACRRTIADIRAKGEVNGVQALVRDGLARWIEIRDPDKPPRDAGMLRCGAFLTAMGQAEAAS